MKERPILFSAPMVRALLAGTKTQTRRVVKPPFVTWLNVGMGANHDLCPYGQPGDRLWVRETWKTMLHLPGYDNGITEGGSEDFAEGVATIAYQAGGDFQTFDFLEEDEDDQARRGTLTWKPSIHMPRWASRITLEVTGVRAERLQDISAMDAISEGIEEIKDNSPSGNHGLWKGYSEEGSMPFNRDAQVSSYRTLWESINGPGSWDANPWVWVVEFKVVKP